MEPPGSQTERQQWTRLLRTMFSLCILITRVLSYAYSCIRMETFLDDDCIVSWLSSSITKSSAEYHAHDASGFKVVLQAIQIPQSSSVDPPILYSIPRTFQPTEFILKLASPHDDIQGFGKIFAAPLVRIGARNAQLLEKYAAEIFSESTNEFHVDC